VRRAAENNPDGRCAVCLPTDVRLVKGGADSALCLACAKDPEKRKVVMEAVAQKRYKRITADPVALPRGRGGMSYRRFWA
jgi:hypothetical protein